MASRPVMVVALLGFLASACSGAGSPPPAGPLRISPSEIGPGERVSIRIVDVDTKVSEVDVIARLERDEVPFESRAAFEVPAEGVVDLDSQAPVAGSYDIADSTGMIWSLTATATDDSDLRVISSGDLEPMTVEISVAVDERVIDQQTLTIHPAPGVELIDVITDTAVPFAAVLLADPSRCPCPTIVVLGGSRGGMSVQPGAALASEGYAVAVVAYFGLEGLPPTLAGINVNLVTPALDWVIEHEVATLPAAIVGGSRGSELAVEAALRDDRIAALVLGAPSSARWVGFGAPAWIDDGQPLPFLLPTGSPELRGEATVTRPVFEAALMQADPTNDPAFLAVDELDRPVLLISGSDDQAWPAEQMAEQIVDRRCQLEAPRLQTINVVHPGAGHGFALPPPWPAPGPTFRAGTTTLAAGGTQSANSAASEATWPILLAYFDQHLNGIDDPRYPSPAC